METDIISTSIKPAEVLHEDEAFLEALKDSEKRQQIIAILTEAGLLP